jgi:hypothetical protein
VRRINIVILSSFEQRTFLQQGKMQLHDYRGVPCDYIVLHGLCVAGSRQR